jgi:hypothetical protein
LLAGAARHISCRARTRLNIAAKAAEANALAAQRHGDKSGKTPRSEALDLTRTLTAPIFKNMLKMLQPHEAIRKEPLVSPRNARGFYMDDTEQSYALACYLCDTTGELMDSAFRSVYDDQANKAQLEDISDGLRRLAREVSSLSETQPDFSERMRDAYRELMAIVYRLRGIN